MPTLNTPTNPSSENEDQKCSAEKSAIPSHELLKGRICVPIEHGGSLYWLRATRAGKLILTK